MRRKRHKHYRGSKPRSRWQLLVELTEQFDLHQNQVQERKKSLLEQADSVFGNNQDRKAGDESHLKELYTQISRLAFENDFLAKVLEH